VVGLVVLVPAEAGQVVGVVEVLVLPWVVEFVDRT